MLLRTRGFDEIDRLGAGVGEVCKDRLQVGVVVTVPVEVKMASTTACQGADDRGQYGGDKLPAGHAGTVRSAIPARPRTSASIRSKISRYAALASLIGRSRGPWRRCTLSLPSSLLGSMRSDFTHEIRKIRDT